MTDRKMWKTGLSFGAVSEAKLKKAAIDGLDLVEINGIDDPANWEKVPQWEKNFGVKVWSIHLPFGPVYPDDPDDKWESFLSVHKALIEGGGIAGIPYMVIHASGEHRELASPETREIRMQRSIAHLSALSDLCKANGSTLCVEVLPRTCLGNCSDEIQRIMDSNSDLRLCFDVNHLLKEDHVEFVKKVGKYAVTTHISDYDFIDEKHWFPLQGQINWRALQSALELVDYKGPFLYETMPMGFTWADVKKNHNYLKNL
ncbi:MAG: sugar phosphate isomerase/epimerase [Clostridia bacterium]|nr:sugar phosphate isomerase/epimerase [Clostridia bacterium]